MLPLVSLSLHEATSEQQRSLLQRGALDIGLVHIEPPELASKPVFSQRFGCAIRKSDKSTGRSSLSFDDLNGLRVMAHSSKETAGYEVRLRAAADTKGVRIDWMFRMFSEHSQLIAESMEVDAVLVSEESARWRFPSWQWIPLDSAPENPSMTTWAAWTNSQMVGLEECLEAMDLATLGTAEVRLP
jgi:DNA-binding transcriptional LysR family regulator